MRLIINQYAVVCFAILVLSGCTTLTFTPYKMYEGGIKNKRDVATVIGQNYWKGWGTPRVTVVVYEVDGKEVFNGFATMSIPFVIQVEPGTHDLTIRAGYGNRFHLKLPIIRVHVEAGQVYQIDSQFDGSSASYSLRHIGNIEEYEDYLAKHPEYEPGSLLPKLSKTYLPRLEQHKTFSPEQFLNYKSPSSKLR